MTMTSNAAEASTSSPDDPVAAWHEIMRTIATEGLDATEVKRRWPDWLQRRHAATLAEHQQQPQQRAKRQPKAKTPTPDTASRDAEITRAVLTGETCADVAARYGLSAGHVRRITAGARQSATRAPRPAPKPARPLRIVTDDQPEALLDASGWPVGIPRSDLHAAAQESPPAADLLPVAGHNTGLLYSNRVCWIAAEAGLGKTWIALQAAIETATADKRVLWIDAEDSAATLAQRLYILRAGDLARAPDLFQRVEASDWQTANDLERAAAITCLAGGLVVIDAAGSTGAGESADSFAEWRQTHLLPGPHGTLVIDHVPKRLTDNDGARLRGPIGSVQKLNAVTGSSLYIAGLPWTDTHPGTLHVSYDKDRPSGLGTLGRRSERIARIQGTPTNGELTLTVQPPAEPREHTPDALQAVVAIITEHPGINTRTIRDKATGLSNQVVTAALRHLTDSGDVTVQAGPRGARRHYIADTHEPEEPPDALL